MSGRAKSHPDGYVLSRAGQSWRVIWGHASLRRRKTHESLIAGT